MERLPAGGGASAVKALVEALGGDDPTARDAAARGLAKAPEAVLPLTRALLATDGRAGRAALRGRAALAPRPRLEPGDRRAGRARARATSEQCSAQGQGAPPIRSCSSACSRELVADLAPAKHVELLFERAQPAAQGRQAGRGVRLAQAAAALARRPRRRDRRRAALLPRAARRSRPPAKASIRTTHADDPVFDAVLAARREGLPGREAARAREGRHRRGALRARLPADRERRRHRTRSSAPSCCRASSTSARAASSRRPRRTS